MKTTYRFNDFTAGMSADIRSKVGFALLQHFRVFPHRLVPQFDSVANEEKDLNIEKFAYAPWLTGYNLFGLGTTTSDDGLPAVYMKDTSVGSFVITASWATPSGGTDDTGGNRSTTVFFPYKNYLYFFSGLTTLYRYGDLTDSPANADFQSISYTNLAPPVHHKGDDCAYFFADNKVYRLNDTTWDGLVLTLPDNLIITSACEYGNYLAIGCRSKSGVDDSIVFLWDRDSSLSTLTARINWGKGSLIHLGAPEGVLIGVTNLFITSLFGHESGSLIIKKCVDQQNAVVVSEFPQTAHVYNILNGNKFETDDRLFFPAVLSIQNEVISGIFAVDSSGALRVAVSEEDADQSVGFRGICKVGSFWFIAHSGDGSVNRTNDQNFYTYTSILETNLFGTPDLGSQLVGATVSFEPLPSGATVTLKYRQPGESDWTSLGEASAEDAETLSLTKDGNGRAVRFNGVQYRIESKGGAVITGFEATHETSDNKAYG